MSLNDFDSESDYTGCCEKNKLSICLSVCVVFLILSIILSFGFFFFIIEIQKSEEKCETTACIRASALISELISPDIDPCEDFYSFVCGKFAQLAYEKQTNNLLNQEQERIERHMDSLIVEPPDSNDPQTIKMQKMYFQACLQHDLDEDRDQIFIRKLLEIGDWPLLRRDNQWDEKNFDWAHIMVKTREMGLPFEWFFKVELYNDETYELQFSLPENCGDELTDEYFAFQRDILEKLIKPGLETYSEFAHLEQFEKKLNRLCANKTNEEVALRRVIHMHFDNVKIVNFLKALTKQNQKWKPESLLAFNLNYVYELNQHLRRTPKKVQANFILWKIIQYFSPYLSESIRERHSEYLNEISEKEISRFEFCLQDTKTKFKFVSEVTQIQNYLESSVQENGDSFLDSIKEQTVDYIENLDWRNNRTRETYLDFYGNLEHVIGGPDEILDENFITNNLHSGKLIFMFDNIIQMIIDWSQTTFQSKMKLLGEETRDTLDQVFEANSKFVVILDDSEQQLIVPVSAFSSFLYDRDFPQYLNYAGLGTVISKELIRGLHLLTRPRFDSFKGFEENKKCLIESLQKSNKHINASLLFSINYESLLAQELAYKTYQTYVENNDEEALLINLDYSPNQLFWIKSSLNWCYHALPEDDNTLDMEEILKYRIFEAIKHSEFFTNDFNCSVDAYINPKNKCLLL